MVWVDVVIVSYNSADHLRACVEPLVRLDAVNAIVVDNASTDGSLATVSDLPVTAVRAPANGGFGSGCNLGAAEGNAPFVLFLNPDARLTEEALDLLVAVLAADPQVGAAAPRIIGADGHLHHSLRRDARLRSTYARALFLHRLVPKATWADEVIRDGAAYERSWDVEWSSGACLLVRRDAFTTVGGFDERFFLYREDMDLCRSLRAAGFTIRFEPRAVARHTGGASAPRAELYPVLAVSRIVYAEKHRGRAGSALERVGVGLEALTHLAISQGGRPARKGHAAALRAVVTHDRSKRAAGPASV